MLASVQQPHGVPQGLANGDAQAENDVVLELGDQQTCSDLCGAAQQRLQPANHPSQGGDSADDGGGCALAAG
jgi:hypothetical protein